MQRIVGATRRAQHRREISANAQQPDLHTILRTLPTLLDGSNLPNGVVEFVLDDFEAPTRQLFDINDGHITLVEPGKCVPWASIAGSPTAWARALSSERELTALQITGDKQLAQRVLAAIALSS
jgi:hypothetical protein